jgi:RHS repeat-associated protein
VHHYHLDHLGSPQAITDGSGGFVKQLRYGPYGEVRTYGSGAFSAWDDREFTGYQKEPLSDHYYAGARYYDPDFALFLSHDPARQFASPYTYTNWNPLGRSDPNGAVADIVAGFDTVATLATAVDDVAAASATATAGNSGAAAVGSASSDPSPSVDERVLAGSHGEPTTTTNDLASSPSQPSPGQMPGPAEDSGLLDRIAQRFTNLALYGEFETNTEITHRIESMEGAYREGGGQGLTDHVRQNGFARGTKLAATTVASGGSTALAKSAAGAGRGLTTVTHFTDKAGVKIITESGSLRAGTFVTVPSEVRGLAVTQVEKALEIAAGKGAYSITFQTPATNLATPFNGPLTSGLKVQFQLVHPVSVRGSTFAPRK